VRVLDDHRLALGDLSGNNRLDTEKDRVKMRLTRRKQRGDIPVTPLRKGVVTLTPF
jgi:hypothetical protein